MSIYKSNDETIPTDTEAYYEVVASQEETYPEEVGEELRVILISGQDLLCNTKTRGTKETRIQITTFRLVAASIGAFFSHPKLSRTAS
jgi:hypothetical protein